MTAVKISPPDFFTKELQSTEVCAQLPEGSGRTFHWGWGLDFAPELDIGAVSHDLNSAENIEASSLSLYNFTDKYFRAELYLK